jgi:hypothetical protein
MEKSKRHNSTPHRKRMHRESRLSSAKTHDWIANYRGKNLIKGYSKWFAVGLLTAITELRMLGIEIDAAREAEIRASVASRAEARGRQRASLARKRVVQLNYDFDADETFDYAPEGDPYGVMWEEPGEESICWGDGEYF